MSILASQAMMGLGMVQDPGAGVMIDLEGSKRHRSTRSSREDQGESKDEEDKELTQLLTELQSRFVQITQLIAQQAAAGGPCRWRW